MAPDAATPGAISRFDRLLVRRQHEVNDEIRRVRRAETGDRIPAIRRWIAGDRRDLIVASRYVVEIGPFKLCAARNLGLYKSCSVPPPSPQSRLYPALPLLEQPPTVWASTTLQATAKARTGVVVSDPHLT